MPVLNESAAPGEFSRSRRFDPHLLIVGGTGRNVGKTECVCRIIRLCVPTRPDIHALKVSAVYPGELLFHGSHREHETAHQLFEETNHTSAKDTGRMLQAGARRVFYLRCDDASLEPAYDRFRRSLPPGTPLICESNSLAAFVKPGLLLVIRAPDGTIKPRSRRLLEQADLILISDGSSGFPEINEIEVNDRGWRLSRR